uniref:Inka box actin regulator 2 n=1 Tax=Myripristis murdjan TaxID=586833 RepID=A0A667Y662_9TELE
MRRLSMKEAGDGLHAQMNSMMGALQELKLLQVQTALESLDISGRPINRGPPQPVPSAPPVECSSSPSPVPSPGPSLDKGPSLDSDYSQDSMDDASDWTSSLMSRSRNRQPLVLGDNVFADLVGNWLDLPELEREEEEEEEKRKRRGERTEICRKFSLTTNIFKKFLRSVRPDRDKLLKERPGWMAPELPEGDLFKRPKKLGPKTSKGSFYLPFWAGGQQNRRQPESRLEKMHPLFDYNTAVWV